MFALLTPEETLISGDSTFKGHAAQKITCRISNACRTADTGAESSISAWSHTLVEIWSWINFYGHYPPFRFFQKG